MLRDMGEEKNGRIVNFSIWCLFVPCLFLIEQTFKVCFSHSDFPFYVWVVCGDPVPASIYAAHFAFSAPQLLEQHACRGSFGLAARLQTPTCTRSRTHRCVSHKNNITWNPVRNLIIKCVDLGCAAHVATFLLFAAKASQQWLAF